MLALAPAGCGKTEALALRAQSLVARAAVRPPRVILALTFSNKARDNLASRMKAVIGRRWRLHVTVTNFHGIAARIVRAHARVVGLDANILLPEESWRRRIRRDLGIGFNNADAFERALRVAKDGPYDDNEVLARLEPAGHFVALEYQRRLISEGRLDYDDLLRHAARLLRIPAVGALYRAHFAAVLVDEVQDLSRLQFAIVRALGDDTVTYAGDPAQGIYSFAGADPDYVFGSIRELEPTVVEFRASYRSSPHVLAAVNVLAREMGTTELTCACPERWPDRGRVIYLECADTYAEAKELLSIFSGIRAASQTASIGVVCRRGSRLDQLRVALMDADFPFQDWTLPTHVPSIVVLLKQHVQKACRTGASSLDQLAALEAACLASIEPADVDSLDCLVSACAELRVMVEKGVSVFDAVATCRGSGLSDQAVSPGVNLLNGHRGKGQEFDWVVVLGLEDGQIPDFRNEDDPDELRILHVMVSRARYGLLFTYARNTMTGYGWRAARQSRWLSVLRRTAKEEMVA